MALHMIRANTVEVPCAVCGDVRWVMYMCVLGIQGPL